MKANELMIGDWVHVEAHRGFNAQNVKVETIPDNDSDNEYGHHYGHIGAWLEGGDNDFRDVEAKHLQPIPLTGEILEKNGWIFQKYPDDEMFIWPLDNEIEMPFRLQIGMDGNRYWVTAGIGGLICSINYVHELQHVLRQCGIEKEIEL